VGQAFGGQGTGTINRTPKDTWFVGFSPDWRRACLSASTIQRTAGQGCHPAMDEQGATRVAAPIFPRFHERRAGRSAARRRSARPAQGIDTKFRWTGKSGAVVPAGTPGAILEAFKAGTAPGESNAPMGGAVGADDGGSTHGAGWHCHGGRRADRSHHARRCRRGYGRSLLSAKGRPRRSISPCGAAASSLTLTAASEWPA